MSIFEKKIFGHDNQFLFLEKVFDKKLSDSWLFFGPEGIGINSLCKNFIIKNLIKRIFDKKIKEFNQLNPFEKKKLKNCYSSCLFEFNNDVVKTAGINEIRSLLKKISLTNYSEKVPNYMIVNNIELLNKNSHNALLKSIEEPPKNTYIFLIAHNLYTLPKTITSRCKKIEFKELSKNDFEKYLISENVDVEHYFSSFEYDFSKGRPGIYEKLKKINLKENLNILEQIIEVKELDYLKVQFLIDRFKGNLNLLVYIINSFLYQKAKLNLIKNINSKKYQKNILDFFEFIIARPKKEINIDMNNYIALIFMNYFDTVKKL